MKMAPNSAVFRSGRETPTLQGVERAAANLLDLVAGCCERAGCAPPDYVRSFSALRESEVRWSARSSLMRCGRNRRSGACLNFPITLETDSRVALEGAFGGGPGVVMIAGTGSILIGKLPDGTVRSVRRLGKGIGR